MPYRGSLVFDFGNGYDPNAFQRMESALVSLGWTYVETSAFVYDQPNDIADPLALQRIWQGIAVVGRASAAIGGLLSALTYSIQLVDLHKVGQTTFGGAKNPNASYADVSGRVFPGDSMPGN